ncbi:hypothetical protein WAI453_000823 [Rhynchosporium graminicola]
MIDTTSRLNIDSTLDISRYGSSSLSLDHSTSFLARSPPLLAQPLARVVNLDFDARVPIPFSIFPSSYRSDDVAATTQTHVEGEIKLPQQEQRIGREGQSSFQANLPPRHNRDHEQFLEEVHIAREEEHHHRPSRREDIYIREETR